MRRILLALTCALPLAGPAFGNEEVADCEELGVSCVETFDIKAEKYMERCAGEHPGNVADHLKNDPACQKSYELCKGSASKAAGSMLLDIHKRVTTKCEKARGEENKLADSAELRLGVGIRNATKVQPTVPVIKAPEKVYFDLTFKIFLSGREECKEKEAKARGSKKDGTVGAAIDDYTLFCQRFYPLVDGLEGDKGNNPLEISNRLGESEKANLRFGKVRATIEFITIEECVAEIKRLDLVHGNIVRFFAAYSNDLTVVCQAIRDRKLNALWQLQTGSKPRLITGTRR